MNQKKFVEEVRQVFTSLAIRCPFSYPLLGLAIKLDPELSVVAMTDATRIIINPTKWNALNSNQKLFVALRQWLHIALLHPKRIKSRKPEVFSAAAEFVVNWMIRNDFKEFEFPPGKILFDNKFAHKSVEEVYKELEEAIQKQQDSNSKQKQDTRNNSKQDKNPADCANGLVSKEQAAKDLAAGKPQESSIMEMPEGTNEAELIDVIIKAAERSKAISGKSLPVGYEEYVISLRKSKVPWTRIFSRFTKQILKRNSDRNPFKPDPKYLPFDIIVPTETGTGAPKVVLVVDTSGSMPESEFEYALGHMQKVFGMCDKLTVITTDVEVQEIVRVRNLKNQIINKKLTFKGRGGTDMDPAFAAADKLKPDLIILYSDMILPKYPDKPKAPVIWLSWLKPLNPPPYGIYIKTEAL